MTKEEIQMYLDEIKHLGVFKQDDERAHSLEDDFFHEFVEYVKAAGDPNLSEKAEMVLSSLDFDFARWCS